MKKRERRMDRGRGRVGGKGCVDAAKVMKPRKIAGEDQQMTVAEGRRDSLGVGRGGPPGTR